MKLIVGLGNPGLEYQNTRHNIGFMVMEKLARELSSRNVEWKNNERHKAMLLKAGDILLVKPLTFMNNTGLSVGSIAAFYKLTPEDVWVVHDDIDLPLGKIRIRQKGGTAGHHGVKSIMNVLKSDAFTRFRLGIGRTKEGAGLNEKNLHHRSVISYVLSKFSQGEAGSLKHLLKHGVLAVRIALTEGIDKAMNRFN